MKKRTIHMTPDGGRWWPMRIVHWAILIFFVPPIVLLLLICLVNPLWFRDDLLIWFENAVNRLSVWRNQLLYRIYLGTDPAVWHSLKDQ